MFFKKLSLALLVSLGLSSAAMAGPIINPLAADLPSASYTASSTYLPGSSTYLAENAFNGTGSWNAGNYGWAWIQADMGSIQTISEVKIQIAQSPNGVTQHQIFLSDTFIGAGYGALTPIYSHSGFTTAGSILDVIFSTPQTGRFLQILSHGGPSWTALGDVNGRINWTQPQIQTTSGGGTTNGGNSTNGGSTNVPEPDMMLLLTLGLMGIGYARRRKLPNP